MKSRFIPAHAGNRLKAIVYGVEPAGSSPRMRGTGHLVLKQGGAGRFIPAHAGNSAQGRGRRPHVAVHPRACGEQSAWPTYSSYGTGSSPRMRGTVTITEAEAAIYRFIPAHAGNRRRWPATARRSPVHPRACGEQMIAWNTRSEVSGSSPRMRGTDSRIPRRSFRERFIPAHAGNRSIDRHFSMTKPVHPRACGEQALARAEFERGRGSSPRMRGTVTAASRDEIPDRFIPAHAGNSRLLCRSRKNRAVHPRACGEQATPAASRQSISGSSPRMRGTERAHFPDRPDDRFIPAHAGNRCPSRPRCPARPVHPRACGEQVCPTIMRQFVTGSSPRMRG